MDNQNNQQLNQEYLLTNSKEGLETLLDKYKSVRAISRETGVPKSTLSDRLAKYGLKSLYTQQTKGNVIFNDRNEIPDTFDIEDLIQKTIALQCSLDNMSTKQTKLSLEIKDNKPIAIGFWGDFHIGAKGTDHLQWRKDVDIISHLDGFYYIGMGDYVNLALDAHKGESFDEILNPTQQIQLTNYGFNKTKKQALGLLRGCHPDRLQQSTDTDIIEEFSKVADCANLYHGAEINLTIGDIQYNLRVRHKAPGESPINTTSAQRKQIETNGEADIVALAHLHYPDVEQRPFQGRSDVAFVRSGTYKIFDEFGQKLNGYKGTYGIPMVILYPKEKRMMAIKDFDLGIKYLQSERNS